MDVKRDGIVTSWSWHHIPDGSQVGYRVNPGDDTPVRVIIGDGEQIDLEMSLASLTSIMATMREAESEARALLGADG